MIAVGWWSAWPLLRGRPPSKGRLRALSVMTFSGWVGTLAGWVVTEVGRQPWIIYERVLVADVVAPHGAGTMSGTLTAYALLYAFLLASYVGTLAYMATKPAASLRMLGPRLPEPNAPPATEH